MPVGENPGRTPHRSDWVLTLDDARMAGSADHWPPPLRDALKLEKEMAFYLLNFTRAGAFDDRPPTMQEQDSMALGLWGLSERSQYRDQLNARDQVVVYVGVPDRAIVGHDQLAS